MAQVDVSKWSDDDLKSTGGLMTPGAHVVAIEEVEAAVSSTGNPMVTVAFKAISPKDSDNGKPLRFQHFSLHQNAIKRYIKLARCIDPKMRLHDPESQADLNELLLGKPLCIKVEVEKGRNGYEDRMKCANTRALTTAERQLLRDTYGDSLVPADLLPNGSGQASADGFTDDEIDDEIPF